MDGHSEPRPDDELRVGLDDRTGNKETIRHGARVNVLLRCHRAKSEGN